MNWGSPGAFFAMGGYGVYVWGAYGVAAALLFVEPLLARSRLHRARREAARAAREDDADAGAAS